MTLRMGLFVGLGSPQRMGTPYSLSLSLYLLPVVSPSMSGHQGAGRVERPAATLAVAGSRDGWMANSSSPVITHERRGGQPHPAERLAVACPETVEATSTLEDFDMEQPILCEGYGCTKDSHPADFIVSFLWPHGCRYRGPRCEQWWTTDAPLNCCGCPDVRYDAALEDVCRIVEVLR